MALGLAAILMSGGCGIFVPNQIHYAWDDAASVSCDQCAPETLEDGFVGLAFSGGGSRAAVFAAAAAEALSRRGIMRHVTHLSSVSGGSFAAAYIGLKAPHRCDDGGAADAATCVNENFDAFTDTMRRDYFWTMELNQFRSPWRITSPSYRVSSLIEVLDDEFLGGSTFADLHARPALLINAADYDDGSRFVFSHLAFAHEPAGDRRYRQRALSANSFSRYDQMRSTPGDFPVALAVATSAAFPGLLGPVTIQMPSTPDHGAPRCKILRPKPPAECEYWHLGDGGILENTGVETLQEVILRRADGPVPFRRALILSFDAGRSLDPVALRRDEDPDFWTEDFDRVVEIANIRAEAYRAVAWESVAQDLEIDYELISFRLVEAKLTEDDWPASCAPQDRHEDGILQHLREIPTHLDITGCDADLTEAAARRLVEDGLTPAVLARLGGVGFVFAEAPD